MNLYSKRYEAVLQVQLHSVRLQIHCHKTYTHIIFIIILVNKSIFIILKSIVKSNTEVSIFSEYPSVGRHAAAVPADSLNVNFVALWQIKSKHDAYGFYFKPLCGGLPT